MTTVKAKRDGRFWAVNLYKKDLIPYLKVSDVAAAAYNWHSSVKAQTQEGGKSNG